MEQARERLKVRLPKKKQKTRKPAAGQYLGTGNKDYGMVDKQKVFFCTLLIKRQKNQIRRESQRPSL
jgi:hypothetical protein